MFFIGYYIGLRWSDYGYLKEVNIKDGFIEKQVEKTDEYIKILILPQVKEIMDRYPEGLPKITNQKVNEYVKVLCKIAELNEEIEVVMHYDYNEKKSICQKSQHILFEELLFQYHRARRASRSGSIINWTHGF